MAVGHKVAGARLFRRFQEELAIRANRLKTVVLYDNGLARQIGEEKRQKRRTCEMKNVSPLNQLPKFTERGLANYDERKTAIIKAAAGGLGSQGYFQSSIACLRRKVSQTCCKGQDECFHSADARWEKM